MKTAGETSVLNKTEFLSNLFVENKDNLSIFIKSQLHSNRYTDVEDCVQETFLIAVKKITDSIVENHPNVKGWLFSIAKNITKQFNSDYMRTEYNINTEVDMSLLVAEDRDFTYQLIEDIVYNDIDVERIKEHLIEKLTENERDLYMLKSNGKSNREISVIFNISENAVSSRYKRIRQKLRKIYEKATPL